MYDVAIVGAGPSGCYTAYLLAKAGYNVVLLEREQDPEKVSGRVCTGIVGKEAFERLPLPVDSILKGISSTRFISPSGETFRYTHPSAFAYILERRRFDLSLLKQALKAGVVFLPDCLVEGLNIERGYIELLCRGWSRPLIRSGAFSGRDRSIKARASVIATGLNTPLLKEAGLKGPQHFLIGVQIEAGITHADEVEVYLGNKVAPGSFAWLVPLGDGRARIGLSTKGDAIPYLKNLLKLPSIKERLKGGMTEVRCRPLPFGPAPKTYGLRVLSVGDAAGQVKTTTGGGIYYGLIGAEIAALTLCEAFNKGDLSPSTLRHYEERWRKVLGPEIDTGIRLRRIYARLGDREIDQLIRIATNDGIIPLIKNKAKFDWQKGFFLSLLSKPIIKHLLGTVNGEP